MSVVPTGGVSQRLLRGAPVDLETTLHDQYGEPAAAAGAVTVKVVRADLTEILPAGSATTAGAAGVYKRNLTAAQNTLLDVLTSTWTDAGDGSVHTSTHEIVGGFYWSIAELRAFDNSLSDPSDYSDTAIRAVRREVEEECERITGVAWVPRFCRERMSGWGRHYLILSYQALRSVRSVWSYNDAITYTPYTGTEIAALSVQPSGWVTRTDYGVFGWGSDNLIVEYEHGYDRPPVELRHASMQRARYRLNMERSGMPDAFVRFTGPDGSTFEQADMIDDVEQRQVWRTYRGHQHRVLSLA